MTSDVVVTEPMEGSILAFVLGTLRHPAHPEALEMLSPALFSSAARRGLLDAATRLKSEGTVPSFEVLAMAVTGDVALTSELSIVNSSLPTPEEKFTDVVNNLHFAATLRQEATENNVAKLLAVRLGGAFDAGSHVEAEQLARQAVEAAQRLQTGELGRVVVPDPRAICAAIPGNAQRLPTYCQPLDALTGGGLQTGRLVVVGGPPGATKTGLVLALSVEMARRGCETRGGAVPVLTYFVAGDEPRSGIYSRVAQMTGVPRTDLDADDLEVSAPAWSRAGEALGEMSSSFVVWDPEEDRLTVEAIAAHGKARAAELGARFLLVVDSLQTAPFDVNASTAGLSPREQMDARVGALKRLRRGASVVAISEVNRGAYSGQGAEANLGSFKESSGIEYGVDLALTLKRLKTEEGLTIEVTPQKNRLGASLDPFRLRRRADCTFAVVDMPDPEAVTAARENASEARVREVAEQMHRELLAASARGITVRNRDGLFALVKGRSTQKAQALAALKTQGRIVQRDGGYRALPNVTAVSALDEVGGSDVEAA